LKATIRAGFEYWPKVPDQCGTVGNFLVGLPPDPAKSAAEIIENEIDVVVVAGWHDRWRMRHHANSNNVVPRTRTSGVTAWPCSKGGVVDKKEPWPRRSGYRPHPVQA
jgi:hypothetical protein